MTSPALLSAAERTRTESEVRAARKIDANACAPTDTLAEVRDLARKAFEAQTLSFDFFCTKPEPFSFDDEEHIRWHIRREKLLKASIDADREYRNAADRFFKEQIRMYEETYAGPHDDYELLRDRDGQYRGLLARWAWLGWAQRAALDGAKPAYQAVRRTP